MEISKYIYNADSSIPEFYDQQPQLRSSDLGCSTSLKNAKVQDDILAICALATRFFKDLSLDRGF